jgi:hypothetical protein
MWNLNGRNVESQKLNTEGTEEIRGPQRNRRFSLGRLLFSVFSVAFLCVLCVKFRNAQTEVRAPCKHFDG